MTPCGCPSSCPCRCRRAGACPCRRPCGCRNVEPGKPCRRCVPSAGLWLTLGAVGVLAVVSEGVRRSGSGNTSSPLADAILADEEAVGPFYEEVIQPFLWDWASREAKKRVRGGSLHAIDTGAWEDVVRQWIRWTQGRAVPAAEITRAALALDRHFDPLWSDWADVRVEEELYPSEPQQYTGR